MSIILYQLFINTKKKGQVCGVCAVSLFLGGHGKTVKEKKNFVGTPESLPRFLVF